MCDIYTNIIFFSVVLLKVYHCFHNSC